MADKKLKYSAEEIDSLLQKVEDGDVDVSIGVVPIDGGHRVTINDQIFDVMDGVDGSAGKDGADGVSPIVTVTEISGGRRITITDKNGTKTIDVIDGQNGQPGVAGKDGVGIQSVAQTTTSTADGGENVVTVTLSNGATPTFKVKNGSKGSTGPAGADGKNGTDATVTMENIAKALGYTPAKQDDVAQLSEEIADLSVADYIKTEATRVANNVQSVRNASTLTMILASDFHNYYGNTESTHPNTVESIKCLGLGVAELQKRMGTDLFVALGDYSWMDGSGYTVGQVKNDITDALYNSYVRDTKQVYCIGNHDLNYGVGRDRMLTVDELYAYISAKSDGVKPYEDMEKGYGYIDFENQKIRVIYLNTCDVSEFTATDGTTARSEYMSHNQIQWLADTALDFAEKESPADWGIVICGHHPLQTGYPPLKFVLQMLEGYRDGTSGSYTYNIEGNVYTVSFDFTNVNDRAEIICNIHGHYHNFNSGLLSSDPSAIEPWLRRFCIPNISANRYNEVATSSDAKASAEYGEFDENGNPVYWRKESGSARATSFCVVSIDKKNKNIYAHTFGVGKDRVFSYAENDTPQYINQLPISTDASGAIYNGQGYKGDTYLSSGNEAGRTGVVTTGFIPIGVGSADGAKNEQVIRLANIEALPTNSNVRISFYDADKVTVGTRSATQFGTAPTISYEVDENGYINKLDVSSITYYYKNNSGKTLAFFRMCSPGIDADSIITVNEEII